MLDPYIELRNRERAIRLFALGLGAGLILSGIALHIFSTFGVVP